MDASGESLTTTERASISDRLEPTRRAVVLSVGGAGLAVALTACTGYQSGGGTTAAEPADPPADDPPAADATEDSGAEEPPPAEEAPPADALAKTADIPEGGGKIFESEKIVITQPTAGQFKCFTAVCTHQGCTVASISNGTINCPCHGSRFKIEDGSVAGGPAKGPLEEKQITVAGGSISLA
ncbi:iron-sulfur protein [Acrocarpospora corrugata]|uniref:Cytochrome bc1 complex Rieske iron-sulfur subunit n=1 Tax=Acrocarpospora corrugata TaxID=35763 RepID=A0A5M3W2F0_9ACTN|nr:Rieske (2Fe-2S) protein [Acrocarpospora corrugata]GES00768.1 iron-sulfur protein [Acrocarpospora corrugata]